MSINPQAHWDNGGAAMCLYQVCTLFPVDLDWRDHEIKIRSSVCLVWLSRRVYYSYLCIVAVKISFITAAFPSPWAAYQGNIFRCAPEVKFASNDKRQNYLRFSQKLKAKMQASFTHWDPRMHCDKLSEKKRWGTKRTIYQNVCCMRETSGEKLLERNCANSSQRLNFHTLSNGVYIDKHNCFKIEVYSGLN